MIYPRRKWATAEALRRCSDDCEDALAETAHYRLRMWLRRALGNDGTAAKERGWQLRKGIIHAYASAGGVTYRADMDMRRPSEAVAVYAFTHCRTCDRYSWHQAVRSEGMPLIRGDRRSCMSCQFREEEALKEDWT